MKRATLITILFATLAVYGCSSGDGDGAAGSGGSGTAGTGGSGTAGTGGSGTAGTGGSGTAGTGGSGTAGTGGSGTAGTGGSGTAGTGGSGTAGTGGSGTAGTGGSGTAGTGGSGTAGTGGSGTAGTGGSGTAGTGGSGTAGTGGSGEVVLYEQDFEPPPGGNIDAQSVTALSGDGWLATTNLLDGNGDFVNNFGVGGAPNATASPGAFFSAVVSGQGGAAQGTQQLSIFNDYFCCGTDRGHNDNDGADGFDKVESVVFQEINPIPAALVGKTITLFFEGKEAPEFAVGGNTTAQGFIKTINGTSFAQIAIASVDTTDLPVDWTSYSVSFDITADKMEQGQILQVGFQTIAEQGEPSTNIYDNVRITEQPTP